MAKKATLRAQRRVTAGGADHRSPAWSADGEMLAYVVGEGADAVWVVSDRRGRVSRVLPGPAEGGASFSPDGALVFTRRLESGPELWIVRSQGGKQPPERLLGDDGKGYRNPAFSPDGGTLAFTCSERGAAETRIHALDMESRERSVLTAEPGRSDARPAFSPDGGELYFDGTMAIDEVAVYALALERGEVHRVTPTGTVSRRPAPISHRFVVVERLVPADSRLFQLVLVDRERARERPLTDGTGDRREPACHRVVGGRVRLAFAELRRGSYEICVARLRGIEAATELGAGLQPDVIEVPPAAEEDEPPQLAAPVTPPVDDAAAAELASDDPADAPSASAPGESTAAAAGANTTIDSADAGSGTAGNGGAG